GRSVKSVESRALSAVVFLWRQQRLQLIAQGLPAGVLEMATDRIGEYRQGYRPEAGEPGKLLFFLTCCRSLLLLNGLESADGGEDVPGLGLFAAGYGCAGRGVFRRGGVRIRRSSDFSRRGCGYIRGLGLLWWREFRLSDGRVGRK